MHRPAMPVEITAASSVDDARVRTDHRVVAQRSKRPEPPSAYIHHKD